jgi:hypothetical protein
MKSILAFSSCCNDKPPTNTTPVQHRIRLVETITLKNVQYQIIAVDSFEFISAYHGGLVKIK